MESRNDCTESPISGGSSPDTVPVKSSAIVKQAPKSPSYCELAAQTNLNQPPVNWLRGNFAPSSEPWMPGYVDDKKAYSSFVMAKNSIDSVGKVDVVSNSENIKKLLKVPYSGDQISMLVHRIGRTIMIDEFDLYKHVFRQQQADWKWLQKFILNEILEMPDPGSGEEEILPSLPLATREQVAEKLMLSKFLFHSLSAGASIPTPENAVPPGSPTSFGSPRRRGRSGNLRSSNSRIPDPLKADSTASPSSGDSPSAQASSAFERQVLWSFENIHMLVGSDMPIFGGGTHPCISLRLSDMKKPINILTGVDYWLDQLMCNVPEVLMCYHLEGFVQRYELVETEDIPNITDTPFSPEVIRDAAQNILSFLKNNATKEGHTYWLFKAKDDDVVKLYDLSTICDEYMTTDENISETDFLHPSNRSNPFTLPVAVLMYRVARNLSEKYPRHRRKTAATVYKLLNDCLELLGRNKYPQVAGSVHFLLSNLYLNYGLSHVNGANSGEDSGMDDDIEEFDESEWFPDAAPKQFNNAAPAEQCSCITLEDILKPHEVGPKAAKLCKIHHIPNSTNLEDCCIQALEYIYQGLEATEVKPQPVKLKPATPEVPSAIPLGYQPLKRPKSSESNISEKGNKSGADSTSEASIERSKMESMLLPVSVLNPNVGTVSPTSEVKSGKPGPKVTKPASEPTEGRALPKMVGMSRWQLELTSVLMWKAMRAYMVLSECNMKLNNYGKSLRYLRLANYCYESCLVIAGDETQATISTSPQYVDSVKSMIPDVLMFAGDAQYHLAHEPPQYLPRHRGDFQKKVYRDSRIWAKAEFILGGEIMANAKLYEISDSIEDHILLAIDCYVQAERYLKDISGHDKASDLADSLDDSLAVTKRRPFLSSDRTPTSKSDDARSGSQDRSKKRYSGTGLGDSSPSSAKRPGLEATIANSRMLAIRLGNAKNVLGSRYKMLSMALVKEANESDKTIEDNENIHQLWSKSYTAYQEGITLFKSIGDAQNVALLYSNCGQLMRMCAFAFSNASQEFSEEEKKYLNEATGLYQKAVEAVDAKDFPNVWESVVWELSGAYFYFGRTLQQRPCLSKQTKEEVERCVAEQMQNSLRLIQNIEALKTPGRQELYGLRVGAIHHNLASMYHHAFRQKDAAERRQKQLRTLAELHYSKAAEILKDFHSTKPMMFVDLQLERVFLSELIADTATGMSAKLKSYHTAISYIQKCSTTFMSLCLLIKKMKGNAGKSMFSRRHPSPSMCSEASSSLLLDSDLLESKSTHDLIRVHEGRHSLLNTDNSAKNAPVNKQPDDSAQSDSTDRTSRRDGEDDADEEDEEFRELLDDVKRKCQMMFSQLQLIAKDMLKLVKSAKKGFTEEDISTYKDIYKASLSVNMDESIPTERPLQMLRVINSLSKYSRVWSTAASNTLS